MSDMRDWYDPGQTWPMMLDERDGRPRPSTSADDAFCEGAEWGAGWAFAIIGMAEAIRGGIDAGRFSREHWEYIGDDGWERWPDGKRSKAPPEGY